VALVGLGSYSTHQLAPALMDARHCYLAGIVTGTPEKEKIWADKYSIPKESIYNYKNFDTIVKNEIIAACKKNNVKLSVGYRLHSEPYTQEIMRMVREKTFGDIRYVNAEAGYYSNSNPKQWRLDKSLSGGGALVNMGVYAIQSAIYGTGENPISVSAQEFSTRPEYFNGTDESIAAQFEFSGGIVGNIFTSHNVNVNRLYVSAEKGWFELHPANSYGPLSGRRSDGTEIKFPHESQQKLQMDDFAQHIKEGTVNRVPGEMGKRDMIIVEAIYQSIRAGGKKIQYWFDNINLSLRSKCLLIEKQQFYLFLQILLFSRGHYFLVGSVRLQYTSSDR